jgi:hypothetical protein
MSVLPLLSPPICQTPLLQLQYKEKQVVKKSTKERWSQMTTLEITKCVEHNPYFSAISEVGDFQYTFCQDCEQNIDRFWLDFGMERLPMWSDWSVTK